MYEIGACLLQLDIADDADASTRLHKLTSEAMNLIATRTRLDRSVLNAVMHQDVLTLSSLGHDPFAHKLDGAFYTQILVSAVSCCVQCSAVLCCVVLNFVLLLAARQCRQSAGLIERPEVPRFLPHVTSVGCQNFECNARQHMCLLQTMWNLSEDQTADLLHLRKLYLTRRCVLSLERKAIIRRLSQIDCHILNPTSCMAELQDLTGALQQNAAEDYQMYYKVARSVYRGVSSISHTARQTTCILS